MQKQLALSAIASLATSLRSTIQAGGEPWMYEDPYDGIKVTVDGDEQTLYLANTHWSDISMIGDDGYNMAHNGRVYLSTTAEWSKDTYFRPNLLGGSMEYDVDLSTVSCGCNAALYVIGMPGVGWDGQPFESTDGMHYCDAAAVGGNYCPEFDIMEANQWAYRATSHSCDDPQNGFYGNCDSNGTCDVDIIYDRIDTTAPTAYGPGTEYDINTLEEFHIRVEFDQDTDGEFFQYSIIMTQDGREVKITQKCNALSNMTQDFENGMTFAMSVWQPGDGNLDWLEHDRCSGSCSQEGFKFKNFQFTTAAGTDNDDTDNDDDEVFTTDIAAGFEAIRNNAHYSDTHNSRTLWQVDQSFDFIEQTLIEMAERLN